LVWPPSRNPDPGPTIDLDELSVGVRPWSLLSDAKTVVVDADLYGGSLSAVVSADAKGAVHDADIEGEDIDLGKIPLLLERVGIPLTGTLEIDAELDLGENPEKDGEGSVRLTVKNATVGPGNIKALSALGGFEVPTVDLGSLVVDIPVKQGKGSIAGARLDGKDVQLELFGDLFLKGRLQQSRVDIDGYMQPTAAFLEREKKFQSLLELGEKMGGMGGVSLPRAKDEEGRYYFSIKGTLEAPNPTLARDNGRRAKQRAQSGPSPAAPPEPSASKERGSRSPMATTPTASTTPPEKVEKIEKVEKVEPPPPPEPEKAEPPPAPPEPDKAEAPSEPEG
jgi:type II secretion system protein N